MGVVVSRFGVIVVFVLYNVHIHIDRGGGGAALLFQISKGEWRGQRRQFDFVVVVVVERAFRIDHELVVVVIMVGGRRW